MIGQFVDHVGVYIFLYREAILFLLSAGQWRTQVEARKREFATTMMVGSLSNTFSCLSSFLCEDITNDSFFSNFFDEEMGSSTVKPACAIH